jgi:hypothetical protein
LRRSDLAELILEGTEDENLLYDATQEHLPVTVFKAICRNQLTPPDLLVFLACDSRSGVRSAAESAIARRNNFRARAKETLMEPLKALVHCPGDEVAGLLESVMHGWMVSAADFAVQCVLARPEVVDDSTWSLISSDGKWTWASAFSSTRTLELLVWYPRISDDDLTALCSGAKARFRGPRAIVARAMLARREPGSDEWFKLLTDASNGLVPALYPSLARELTTEQARSLFYQQGPLVQFALDSG